MVKIFVTGVTGFVGGDVVAALGTAHPEYGLSCLVRDKEKGTQVSKAHPDVRLVYGDLDDAELMEEEASKADIVCHLARATHDVSAKAFIKGLNRRHDTSRPGYLVHATGSGIMLFEDVVAGRYGQSSDKVYDDLEGLAEVEAVPDFAGAREAERAVRNASTDQLKTAIVCMGTVYGRGRGIKPYRSASVHDLARVSLERGEVIQVNDGQNAWGHVHITDVTDLYMRLIEDAAGGWDSTRAAWGPQGGFYFAEGGEHVWGETARWVAAEAVAQGSLRSMEVASVSPTEAGQLVDKGQFFWGCNSRTRGKRAREVLKWQPRGPSLRDEVSAIVAAEASQLGFSGSCGGRAGVSDGALTGAAAGQIACTHTITTPP